MALWDPGAMVTDAGTVTSGEALFSEIWTAMDAAGPFSETVPVEVLPPAMVEGLKDKPERTAGVTLILAS